MARRVFVHIGAPKCGTTFVQSVLLGNRTRLASDGLLFPGRKIFDHNLVLMAVQAPESASGSNPRAEQTWQALRAAIGNWPGDAILTNEWFVRATDEQASRARHALDGAELHVVYTARAYVHQIPAGWQETLKRGLSRTLPEFVAGLDDDTAKYSWWTLDPAQALSRWAGDAIPASRVHVVTVPPKGSEPGLLWQRFAGVLGIDPDPYDLETAEPNASLSAEAVALLQRLGPELRTAVDADRGHWTEQYRWIRGLLSHRMLAAVPGSPIGIDPELAATLHDRSVAAADAISHAGYDLVGDLDDLRLTGSPPGSRDPATVTDAELLDVATDLIAQLFAEVRAQTVRAERTDRPQRGEDAGNGGVRHDRDRSLDPTTASRGDHDADL